MPGFCQTCQGPWLEMRSRTDILLGSYIFTFYIFCVQAVGERNFHNFAVLKKKLKFTKNQIEWHPTLRLLIFSRTKH